MRRLLLLAAVLPLAIAPKSDHAPAMAATAAAVPAVAQAPLMVVTPTYDRLDDLIFATLPVLPKDAAGEERCLAQAVYFEARSESLDGQLAVAQVVLNRVADRRYPTTVCHVVFQNQDRPFRCQFSFACDGRSDNPHNRQAWAIARAVAHVAIERAWRDLTDRSTHYHAAYVEPSWMKRLDRRVQVGRQVFYRDRSF